MTTTPEPAVSPAPDTDALREQVARRLHDAAVANGYEFDALWDERSQKVQLKWLAYAADAVLPIIAEREAAHAEVARTWEAYRLRSVEQKREWRRKVAAAEEETERLRAELARSAGARPIPDDAAERIHAVVEELCTGQDDANGGTVYFLDHHEGPQELAREVLKALGATPTTGPAPASEQTNPSQVELSGSVPQRFQATDMQTNAGPVPAAADEVRVEMADRLYAVWELATAATRDGHGLTGEQAARIEYLADIRHPLDAGDPA